MREPKVIELQTKDGPLSFNISPIDGMKAYGVLNKLASLMTNEVIDALAEGFEGGKMKPDAIIPAFAHVVRNLNEDQIKRVADMLLQGYCFAIVDDRKKEISSTNLGLMFTGEAFGILELIGHALALNFSSFTEGFERLSPKDNEAKTLTP